MDAIVQKDRVVEDRNRVTAGIDFALTIAARLADEETAKRIQLLIEYEPKPPLMPALRRKPVMLSAATYCGDAQC
jgi:hypothetical protein